MYITKFSVMTKKDSNIKDFFIMANGAYFYFNPLKISDWRKTLDDCT